MSYSKDDSAELTDIIGRTAAKDIDTTMAPLDKQNKMLRALVSALETGLKIVHKRHYAERPEPEPFPGACKAVVEQGLAGISLARKSGLIP